MLPGGCGPLDPLHQPAGAGKWLRPDLDPVTGSWGPPLPVALGCTLKDEGLTALSLSCLL